MAEEQSKSRQVIDLLATESLLPVNNKVIQVLPEFVTKRIGTPAVVLELLFDAYLIAEGYLRGSEVALQKVTEIMANLPHSAAFLSPGVIGLYEIAGMALPLVAKNVAARLGGYAITKGKEAVRKYHMAKALRKG